MAINQQNAQQEQPTQPVFNDLMDVLNPNFT